MEILYICGAAILVSMFSLLLKDFNKGYAAIVAAAGAVGIAVLVFTRLTPVIEFVSSLAERGGINEYFSVLIKCLGIGLLSQAGADMCRDLGENGIAGKVELAGRITILVLCLPVLRSVIDMSLELVS